METRHVKLTNEYAISAKKQLLSSEINLLYMIKNLSRYKLLRKREFVIKNKLKTALTSTRAKLNLLLSTLPDNQGNPRKIKRKARRKQEEKQELTEELEDIQDKLAKLS